MKTLTTVYACISVLLLVSCGGNVRLSDEEPNSTPLQCSGWQEDATFASLNLDGDGLHKAFSMCVFDDKLWVVFATSTTSGLAFQDGTGWKISTLPDGLMAAGLVRSNGERLYMAGLDEEYKPALYSGDVGWQSYSLPHDLVTVEELCPGEADELFVYGSDYKGGNAIYRYNENTWIRTIAPTGISSFALEGIWSGQSQAYAYGSVLNEAGSNYHGLLLKFDVQQNSWLIMQLPMDSRVVNGVYAEKTGKLWISGQTQAKHAVLYEVDSNTLTLSTHTADAIYSYASLLGNGKGTVEVAGFSNPYSTDLEGDFANLWMTTVSDDSDMASQLLEEVSAYPVDMQRVDKMGTTFLLTETRMYTRVCR